MRTLLIRLSPLALLAGLAACASAPPAPKPSITPAAAAAAAAQPKPAAGVMQPIPNPEPQASPAPHPSRRAEPSPRPAAKPEPPRRDTARAAQLRAQGLEDLNRGAVDRAIAALQQAKSLDPGNALIQRDLERAQRIGRAVKGK
jgi:hypothetical protein